MYTPASVGKIGILSVKKNDSVITRYRPDLGNAEINIPTSDVRSSTTGKFNTTTGGLLESCDVKLEQKQNLHGYTKPWVGGSGKNKLPMTVSDIKSANVNGTWSGNEYTYNNVVFTVLVDNDNNVIGIKANGTASSNANFRMISAAKRDFDGMILNGCPSGGADDTYYVLAYGGSYFGRDYGEGATLSSGYSQANAYIAVSIRSGYNAQNVMFYPMVRPSTVSDATFEPYTNICGITGHSSVDVRVIDKDLLTHTATTQTLNGLTFTVSGTKITVNGTATAQTYIEIGSTGDLPEGDYWYSGLPSDASNTTYFITRNAGSGNMASDRIINTSGVQVPRLYVRNGITCNNVVFDIAISKAYEKTTTSLGQTVYGGSLDVVSGVLTIDRLYVVLDGSEDEGWSVEGTGTAQYYFVTGNVLDGLMTATPNPIYNKGAYATIYSSNTTQGIYITGRKVRYRQGAEVSLSDFKASLSNEPLQICYYITTPTTIQLTPQQINTLIGENHLDVPLEGQSLDSAVYRELFAWDDVNDVVKAVDDKNADVSAIGTDESGRTTASKAYAIGEHFYKDGKFGKTKTAVAQGATWTLNTNYEESTIADAFKSLDEYVISDSSGNAVIQAQTSSWMIIFAPNGLYTLVVTTAYQWHTLTKLFESGASASYDTSTGKLTISGVGNNRHILVKRNPL